MGALNLRAEPIESIEAAANLTDKEGFFYKLDASNKAVLCSATTDVPRGVILQGAALGGFISGQLNGAGGGTVPVKLGTNVTDLRKNLTIKADGTAESDDAAGARVVVAIPLETGVADEKIECVLVNPVVYSS